MMILFPMLLAGIYFYTTMSSVLTKNANENFTHIMKQINDNIHNTYNIINNTSLHTISNKTIRSWISDDNITRQDKYNLFVNKTNIEEELKYSMMFNNAWDMKLVTSAYIFLDKTIFCSVSRQTQIVEILNQNNQKIYDRYENDKTRGILIIPPSEFDQTIYFKRTATNINTREKRLVLIIGTTEAEIFKKYSELLEYPGSIGYIIDDKGIIYSSPNKEDLGKAVQKPILDLKTRIGTIEATINNKEYFMESKGISDSGLTFIAGIPKKQILSKLSKSMRDYLLITFFIVVIFLIASIILSLRFTRFIKDLLRNINKVKVGDYDSKMISYKDVELNLLSNTFNNMTGEIKYLINQVYEKQLLLKETEFKFLQSQMNPHFLFNTLVTIGYKARLSEDETVYKMVMALTELLQAGIYQNSKDKITIKEELEFVEFYLYLQKVRFEDKFEYSINISEESDLNLFLPKLCLEPIVENAVVHGLENKLGIGSVEINIRMDSESVYFEIIDDGVGFETKDINLENNEINIRRKKGHNNIGLNNTNKRIKLIYGEEYGIMVESESDKGTKVTVHIPVDKGVEVNV